MAADPDDKHMPASVRTAYRCEKDPTGDLNRDSLINHINEIALNTPDTEEKVKFEAAARQHGVRRSLSRRADPTMMRRRTAILVDPVSAMLTCGARRRCRETGTSTVAPRLWTTSH